MSPTTLILFFFSALGAFNGFLLAGYFIISNRKRQLSQYLLAVLMLALSLRIGKSVLLYFDPELDEAWKQIGLSACLFIGPALYAYVDAELSQLKKMRNWWVAIAGVLLVGILIVGILYSYPSRPDLWNNYFVSIIYGVWKVSLIFVTWILRRKLKRLIWDYKNLSLRDKWMISIYIGNVLIGLAFFFANKTTYIMGPMVFSVLSYWLGFLWYYRKQSNVITTSPVRAKYDNKRISDAEADHLQLELRNYLEQSKVYANTQVKSADVASAINITTHKLSQLINDNLNTNYNSLINTYRIKAAKELITNTQNLSLEGIATEVGFRSKSAFYEAFKKEVGQTPGAYKKGIVDQL